MKESYKTDYLLRGADNVATMRGYKSSDYLIYGDSSIPILNAVFTRSITITKEIAQLIPAMQEAGLTDQQIVDAITKSQDEE